MNANVDIAHGIPPARVLYMWTSVSGGKCTTTDMSLIDLLTPNVLSETRRR